MGGDATVNQCSMAGTDFFFSVSFLSTSPSSSAPSREWEGMPHAVHRLRRAVALSAAPKCGEACACYCQLSGGILGCYAMCNCRRHISIDRSRFTPAGGSTQQKTECRAQSAWRGERGERNPMIVVPRPYLELAHSTKHGMEACATVNGKKRERIKRKEEEAKTQVDCVTEKITRHKPFQPIGIGWPGRVDEGA